MGVKSAELIESTVLDFIADRTGLAVADIPKSENLLLSGMLDSFGFMELILHLEQTLQVAVQMDEHVLEKFGTIEAIVTSLQ